MSEELYDFLTLLAAIFCYIMLMSPFIVITVIRNRKIKNRQKEDPDLYQHIIEYWSPYFSPIELAILTSYRSDAAYLLYLAELARQNIIKIRPDCQYIAYPVVFDMQTWQCQVINVLDKCRQYFERQGNIVQCDCGYWLLPTQALSPKLNDILFSIRTNVISKLICQKMLYVKNNWSEFDVKKLKDDIYVLITIPVNNTPRIDFLQLVYNNSNPFLPILYAQKYSTRMWYDNPEDCDVLTKITQSAFGTVKAPIFFYVLEFPFTNITNR